VDKEEYIKLFERLGFQKIAARQTLKHNKLAFSIYFNSQGKNKYPAVYFTIHQNNYSSFNTAFWDTYPPQQKKDTNEWQRTVAPKPGLEEQAFRHILNFPSAEIITSNINNSQYMPTKGDIESVLSGLPRNKHHDVDMILNLLEKKLLSEGKILCSGWRTLIEVRFTSWF